MNSNSKLAAWGRLLRLPNLLTVPGDPAAGFLLAGGTLGGGVAWRLAAAVSISMCFYIFGLILNDFCDIEKDRRERPDRPLPGGAINKWVALVVGIGSACLGLVAAFLAGQKVLMTAAGLLAAIVLYDCAIKKIPAAGPLNMGLCRGLSVILGASAAPAGTFNALVITAGTGVVFYVAALSDVAARETEEGTVGGRRWFPFAALCLCFGVFFFFMVGDTRAIETTSLAMAVLAGVYALARTAALAHGLGAAGALVSLFAGGFIQTLLIVQAAFCAATGGAGLIFAVALLAMAPAFGLMMKRFYSS